MSSIQETNLKAIADAIRAKDGTTAAIQASKFPERIAAIQTGVTPKLVVTTSAGATVTATKGSKTVSGTAGTDGVCTLELPEAGEWSVTAELYGNSRTQIIQIGTQSMDITLSDATFENNSWATIIGMCQAGTVPDTWVVGNSKIMTINGTDYQIDIIGKNHDDYADGSGKAPLTFQMHDCYKTTYDMNVTNTNAGGWKNSAMRTTHLPSILTLMPTEVQHGIREVNKKTSVGSIGDMDVHTIETVSDKLFLLSEIEIFGSTPNSATGEGTQYDYYKTDSSKIKYRNGSAAPWWDRSPYITDSRWFCRVTDAGEAFYQHANGFPQSVAFAFCF